MLIIKSKYKIAKRLGAGVFEQTQTQKFALSEARAKQKPRGRRGGSDYGRQLLEKQRVRFTYGLSERQLSNYVQVAMRAKHPAEALHKLLESRADNAIYRAGFASTRRAGRQAISHGHLVVGGKRITTPSYALKAGETIAVRAGSRKSPLFAGLADRAPEEKRSVPQWLEADANLLEVKVKGEPAYQRAEAGLDYATVFEFYSR
ncbi:MAG TPA: 30S ribosomal protein S4 [Candidatus Paceibacterota bacterium]